MAGCRIFDGTSYYAEAATSTDYNGLSGFTIHAYVYRAATGQHTIPWTVANGTTNAIALYWWTDNVLYMDVRNGSTKTRQSAANTTTGWCSITGVFDGTAADASRMKVYLNAVDITSTGTTSNPTATSSNLAVTGKVGRLDLTPVNIASGHALAYVSIYNVALTQREINELHIDPTSPQRGRLHCWALNGNDTTATHTEPDLNRVHALTGNSMSSTSASMLSPKITIGASPTWL